MVNTGAANRRKGASYEVALVNHFREEQFDTERMRLSGTQDEGDLILRAGPLRVVVEAKSGTNIRPRHWYESEAVPEALNYAKRRSLLEEEVMPALVMKSHGKNVKKSLVTIDLESFVHLLRRAYTNEH